jgi:hypothetical protein
MNRIFKFITIILVAGFIASCGSKKDDTAAQDDTSDMNWTEMDDFHMVMAETFHPYKDSSDLRPAKEKAAQLVSSADKWASSKLPEKVDNDGMKEKLQSLKSECEVLVDVVQVNDDEAIGAQLTKVHDLFHNIQEAWYGGDEHHGHEH